SSQPPPAPTQTPSLLSRANPNIVEEDEFHVVERMPKSEYIKIDERHIRHPVVGPSVEFFKEDDNYYYVYSKKRSPESEAIDLALTKAATAPPTATPNPAMTPTPAGPPLSDFEDLLPPREGGRMRLEAVAATGLPNRGLWRASFVVADVNGDKIPDIV